MRQYILFYAASLLTLAQIVLAVLIEVPAGQIAGALALILGLLAALFIYWSLYTLFKHGRSPNGAAYFQTTAVVDRGPYMIVRHPQYLGYILINLTFILCNPTLFAALLGGAAIVCFYLYAGQEDDRLRETLGPDYQDYMQRVPSFNPLVGLVRLLF
ncbi:MAG: methyltransferase family protein [Candidatus Promineifilaceae bacterium]|jgi:protein-S-isoprenylcysteine O-methyltransferase Ste14